MGRRGRKRRTVPAPATTPPGSPLRRVFQAKTGGIGFRV